MVSRLSWQLSVYQQLEAVIFIATWISDFATRKDKWVPDCRICCIALKQIKYILQIHRYSLLLGIRSCEGVALIWKGKRWETLECLPTHVVQNAVKRIGSRQTKFGGGGGGDKQGVSWAMRIWWIAVLVERRTFGNLLQQDWFRSLPRYDHRDVVGRPENSIKANDQHISPWNTRAFSTHPIS